MSFFSIKTKKNYASRAHYEVLTARLGCPPPELSPAFHKITEQISSLEDQEVCLFVTHCPQNRIKPHVIHHVQSLISMGIHVILIINADSPSNIGLNDQAWLSGLSACFVRKNIGLDFGGWSDVFRHYHDQTSGWKRLYLINDSIVGPVDDNHFKSLINRIRSTDADFHGLVANTEQRFHLQSFFLVFEKIILSSEKFRRYLENVQQFTEKQLVIDVYESRLTQYLQSLGFRPHVLFELARNDRLKSNATLYRWEELLDAGFCYAKASVILDQKNQRNSRLTEIRKKYALLNNNS